MHVEAAATPKPNRVVGCPGPTHTIGCFAVQRTSAAVQRLCLLHLILALAFSVVCVSSTSDEAIKEYGEDYVISGDDDYGDEHHLFKQEEHRSDYSGPLDSVESLTKENPAIGQKQMAYTLSMNEDCTAVLIHKNWVLSAFHCLGDKWKQVNQDHNGDKVLDVAISIRSIGGGSNVKPSYIAPLQANPNSTADNWKVWRKVEKVYTLDFRGEKEIYKGNDLILLKLAEKVENPVSKYIAPICLPDVDSPDLEPDLSDKLFFIGLGRRRIPHCITDIRGPDQAAICGRPKWCSREHKIERCGLEFLYKGKLHNKCITTDTPSAADPNCQRLIAQMRQKIGAVDFKKKTFVFNSNGSLLTTCYPAHIKKGRKGWCTTRDPWLEENKEPQPDEGWGFCGEEDYQQNCNGFITKVIDTSLMPVSQLDKSYCVRELKKNIEKELPGVPEEDYNDLGKTKLVCIGKNITQSQKDFQVFGLVNDTFVKLPLDKFDKVVDSIEKAIHKPLLNVIKASGACFGDSGGPLVKYVGEKPVLIGIMSFLLWGTCRSRFEPTFYTRIKDHLDLVLKHIPKEELCFG